MEKSKKANFSVGNIKQLYSEYGIVFVLILLIIIATALNPIFISGSNIMNVLRQVSINGILSIGMTFVIISGCIDLSVGNVLGCTGLIVMILMERFGMVPAILAGLAFGLLVGVFNGWGVHLGLPAFIMTLASQQMVKGLGYVISNGQPFSASDEAYKFIGQGFLGFLPMPVVIFAVLVIIAWFILTRTRIGRSVYAVGGNPEASRLSGINIRKVRIFAYVVSGVMSAVAAIVLTSRLYSCDPLTGDNYQSDAIAATVIGGCSMAGGEGSVLKTVVGVLIIGIISNILNLLQVSSYLQMIAKGFIIFLAVFIDVWKNK